MGASQDFGNHAPTKSHHLLSPFEDSLNVLPSIFDPMCQDYGTETNESRNDFFPAIPQRETDSPSARKKKSSSSPNNCLVGGFNPFETYSSTWESSPGRGENKKYLKPLCYTLLEHSTRAKRACRHPLHRDWTFEKMRSLIGQHQNTALSKILGSASLPIQQGHQGSIYGSQTSYFPRQSVNYMTGIETKMVSTHQERLPKRVRTEAKSSPGRCSQGTPPTDTGQQAR